MAETTEAPVQVSTEQQTEQPTVSVNESPFSGNAWSESVPEEKQVEVKQEVTPSTNGEQKPAEQVKEEEEIIDPKEWLKREFETDDPEVIKQQIKEYNRLKDVKPFEYKNEDSKRIAEYINEGKEDELYKYLDTKKKIEKLTTTDLSDKTIAAELVKFGIQRENPNLTTDEIEFLFNEKYSFPQKPVQTEVDTEDEYQSKVQGWQTQVANMEKRLIIEAKMNQPKLAQLKSEIVLPEISKPQVQNNEPTEEQLAQEKLAREKFLNKLESDYSKVEGFSTKVKNESVELPVQFKIPDEEKMAIKKRLEVDGLNVQDYMFSRWVDESGNWNIEKLITDLYDLENREKILSGVANNAANKMLENYLKQQKNLNLNGQTPQQTFNPNQDGRSNVSPFAKDAWSEKPPVLVNN